MSDTITKQEAFQMLCSMKVDEIHDLNDLVCTFWGQTCFNKIKEFDFDDNKIIDEELNRLNKQNN